MHDDSALIHNIQKGAIDHYALLIERHQRKLHSALLPYCPNRAEVEYFIHDAFVHAYQKIDKFDPKMPFFPWLKQLALNNLRDELRSRGAHSQRLTNYLLSQIDVDKKEQGSDDLIEAMQHCFSKLEDTLQELVRERYYKKTTLVQIAAEQNKKLSAMKMQMRRTREILKKCIKLQLGNMPK